LGNNQAFTIFEATVIATYDKGVLDKELLTSFISQYKGVDIDSGGKRGTLSKDGLEVEQIVLKIFGVELPVKPEFPGDYRTWTEEQTLQVESYFEKLHTEFYEITDKLGWR